MNIQAKSFEPKSPYRTKTPVIRLGFLFDRSETQWGEKPCGRRTTRQGLVRSIAGLKAPYTTGVL